MSEFSEVIKQLGRICASNFGECDICDLRPFCPSKTFLDKYAKSARAERLEELVMAWAAEHPEPVYPSVFDWLVSVGLLDKYMWSLGDLEKPIPADIAQKLGIAPKEELWV